VLVLYRNRIGSDRCDFGRFLVASASAAASVLPGLPPLLTTPPLPFNLQGATRVAANDKPGRERLRRYILRPPLANAWGAGRLCRPRTIAGRFGNPPRVSMLTTG
jgi:hypothetical protein